MKTVVLLMLSLISATWSMNTSGVNAEQGSSDVSPAALPARRLPLSDVCLTDGPLKHAQDLDAKYLLSLEPDRMLAYYRERAGLDPKAEPYGGWDGGGRNLTGHIAGHYLSAVSLMWAATGDQRFKQRADYIVDQLKEVQDAHGDGYLVALENGRECFDAVSKGEIRSGGFDLNGLWAPWYVLHKTYAGLRDAYRYTGNQIALDIEVKFAEWCDGVMIDLSDEQVQKMLNTEFGGMNEVMTDLYADTDDPLWLKLSYKFEHDAIVGPLRLRKDILPGKHGNTQVPKLIGSADRFAYAADADDLVAARFFWDRVVHHHSFATGGHGQDEYFGQPDELHHRVDGRTAETCNVYNMLKLTRRLFETDPDTEFAEFHERALLNHILASIDPEDGRTCYMVPVGRGVRHEYSDMQHNFTCCVGSGMESHALHGDGIYYESTGVSESTGHAGEKRLWVNLYAPSTAVWKSVGVRLAMKTDFPEGETATLKLEMDAPRQFTLALRRPAWSGKGFALSVNGQAIKTLSEPGSYVELDRNWKDGDRVDITLPKELHLEPVPDNPNRAALMWGPLVLAGDLGPENQADSKRDHRSGRLIVPVFVAADRPVHEWLKPIPERPGCFRSDGVGRDADVDFVPFYRLHRRTYAVYWDLFTSEQWAETEAEYTASEQRQYQLDQATVAFAQPGEMQPERDYAYQSGDDARVVRILGRAGRNAGSWFSLDMPVDPQHPMTLIATYYSGEWKWRGRTAVFNILADGEKIGTQRVTTKYPHEFYDVEYKIPRELARDKEKLTIRFQAADGSEVASVLGVRMIRADAER